jgi:hypothetical protein
LLKARCLPSKRGEAALINISLLNRYVGKNISQICPNGYDDNNDSHCAHFVAHVLRISEGTKCTNLVHGPGPGASVRVDDVFNKWCPKVIDELSKPSSWSSGWIFIINPKYVRLSPRKMQDVGRKHMGIFVGGSVWHYSNTQDKVVRVSIDRMKKHYPSASDNGLFFGTVR